VFAALRRFVALYVYLMHSAVHGSIEKVRTISSFFSSSYIPLCIKAKDLSGINSAMTRKNPMAVALGSRGGKATAKKMTPEERKEKMRRAAQARWAKAKKKDQ
jgi:hypothetical protein